MLSQGAVRSLQLILFHWIVPLLCSIQMCPDSQYPFSCSACLSFSVHNSTRSVAGVECEQEGGALVTVQDDVQWRMLLLYLESLNLTQSEVWVGYRLGEGGELRGEQWESAPSAVVESIQRSLSVRGVEGGECVVVIEGEMVNSPCSEEWRHLCLFIYTAPHLAHSQPPLGAVYQAPLSTLSLEASIVGLKITDVEWRHNQMLLTPSASIEMRGSHDHSLAELHIPQFEYEVHGGSYELLVTNPAGRTVIATWNIEQASVGRFSQMPQDLTIPEDSIAAFECSVEDAAPAPTYTWYKGDDPIVSDGMKVYVSNVTHTLLMRDVGEQDEGSYHCRVENSAGYLESGPATLTILSQQQFAGSEARYLLQPHNATVLEGKPYSVECVALHISPSYQYFINSYLNLHSIGSNNFLYPTTPGLPVKTVSRVSRTEYNGINSFCYSGPLGFSLIPSRQSVLTVHTFPRVKPLVSSVGDGNGPHTIPPGTKLGIQCTFSGVPNPIHKWYRNGNIIQSDSGVVVSGRAGGPDEATQDNLTLVPVSGVYQCQASNQYGAAISTTVLCEQSLPGATPFIVQADTTSSLYVTWSRPELPSNLHPFLLRYNITARHTRSNHTVSSGPLLLHQSPWVVKGLNMSSEYEVKVISWSPLGVGEEGPGQTVFTFGPAPQQSPVEFLNITVSRTHQNTGLVVQWYITHTPPPGTVFTYYQVRHRMREEDDDEGELVQVYANQRWAFVDDLENARNYEVQLRVAVQIQRSPPAYDYTPWTEWLSVQGVTTPPPTTSTSSTTPDLGSIENEGKKRDDVLLVAVLVPILSVVVLVALLVPVMVGGWRLWAKRRAATYNPSRMERQLKGRRIPMGKDIFTLPVITSSASIEEVEEGRGYSTLSTLRTTGSSRPSSQSEELTVETPVHMQSSNVE